VMINGTDNIKNRFKKVVEKDLGMRAIEGY
jgi:hypothetical protein